MSTYRRAAEKPLAVALTGDHLATLLADRELTARLDAAGLAFAVAGIDRIDGTADSSSRTVESTIAVSVLATRAPGLGWLAAAAVHRDHPYNLARRVASADHLAGGRTGLLLGISDGYAPSGEKEGHEVWGGARLTPGVPLGLPTALDAAEAIRDLWLSWPSDSIVADKATGIYARGEQILRIDHHGVFDVEGPLTVPTTPQTAPVLAWYARTSEEAKAAGTVPDLVISPALIAAAGVPLYVVVPVPASDLTRQFATDLAGELDANLSDDQVAGVILRPAPGEQSLRDFLTTVVPDLTAAGTIRLSRTAATLRHRLNLPAPARLYGGRPAFPAPAPLRVPGP